MGPEERLELFLPICQAVQHAHQKGIIHRDLKPSNILIARYDDQAVPKVIDFGVAKATGEVLTEKTLFTQLGQVLGTVEYMSPEQAQRNQLDVDTRSDVYSLGVLLYELLTGTTPIGKERLREAALDEVLRLIREEEPQQPSKRLSSIDKLPGVAANRRVEPHRLTAMLRGELDWIVMKALEKDRARRYATSNELAEDIRCYLDSRPVQARPPSKAYLLSKFYQRHRGLVAAASAVLICLAIGLVSTSVQAYRASRAEHEASQRAESERALRQAAQQQRNRAERYLGSATSLLESMSSASAELSGVESAQQTLQRVNQELLDYFEGFVVEMEDNSRLVASRASALQRMATIKNSRGMSNEAISLLKEAIDIQQVLLRGSPDSAEQRRSLALSYNSLGAYYGESGKPIEALAAFQESLTIRESLLDAAPDDPENKHNVAASQMNVGIGLLRRGERERGLEQLRRAHAAHQQLAESEGAIHESPHFLFELSNAAANLGVHLADMGQHEEARKLHEQSRDVRSRLAERHPGVAAYRNALAFSQRDLARFHRRHSRLFLAGQAAQRAHVLAVELVNENRARREYWDLLIECQILLARLYADTDRNELAAKILTDTIALIKQRLEESPDSVELRERLVETHAALGLGGASGEQKLEATQRALELYSELVRDFPDKARYRVFLINQHVELGDVYYDLGQYTEALASAREARRLAETHADKYDSTVAWQGKLAHTFTSTGRTNLAAAKLADAVADFSQARKLYSAVVERAPDDYLNRQNLAVVLRLLGTAYWKLDRHDEALTAFDEGVRVQAVVIESGPEFPQARLAIGELFGHKADLLLELDRPMEAGNVLLEARDVWKGFETSLFTVAHELAACAAQMDTPDRDRFLEHAIDTLEESILDGYRDLDRLKSEEKLAPLRENPRFLRLIKRLEERKQLEAKDRDDQ